MTDREAAFADHHMSSEPEQLRRGKKFHKQIQDDWEQHADGQVSREKRITKTSGRRGRIDIHAKADDDSVAVVEIKASDWDKMTLQALRRNVRRQIKQIWGYIEAELQNADVSPGVIFPQRPKDRERTKLIEEIFEEDGIPVVWNDETIEERKRRG